jgi:hypothetical protein
MTDDERKAKLHDILRYRLNYGKVRTTDAANNILNRLVAQIDAVYREAGYRNINEYGIRTVTKEQLMNELDPPTMTGQEWYDRFMRGWPNLQEALEEDEHLCPEDMIAAARRAAGLDGDARKA